MKKVIGVILIILGIFLGYLGVTKISDSGGSVNILGIELSASDEGMKTEGYIYTGLAVLSFVGGIFLVGKKN